MKPRAPDRATLHLAKWTGTGAGIAGASLIALNLGVVGYAFVLFLVSSVLWSAVGFVKREPRSSSRKRAISVSGAFGFIALSTFVGALGGL